jgi:VCBS repeat-containing protein
MSRNGISNDGFIGKDVDGLAAGDDREALRSAYHPSQMIGAIEQPNVDQALGSQPLGVVAAPNVTEGFSFSLGLSTGFAAAQAGGAAVTIDLSGLGKLHFGLANIFAEAQMNVADLSPEDRAVALLDFVSSNALAHISNGMIAIDAVANGGDGAALLVQLQALGMVGGESFGAMAGGYLPIDSLDELAALDLLNFAQPVYTLTHVGTVTGQQFLTMNVDTATSAYASAGVNATLNGTGLTVGVISDSFDTRTVATTHYAGDVTTGDLPAGITILSDPTPNGTDEGRAMAQAVYDVASGVNMAFSSANPSQAAFANSIVNLAKPVAMGGAGADIVVDDVIYFAEPMFQDGIIAQAVGVATGTYGAMYFSSAGNQSTASYNGVGLADSGITFNWTGSATPANNGLFHLLDFDPGAAVDAIQTVSITGSTTFIFNWDQAAASAGGSGSTTDIAIFLYLGANPNVITNVVQVNNIGGDPIEGFSLTGSGSFGISIGVRDTNALPGVVKWVQFGPTAPPPEYANFSATSYGHANAETAISVGASHFADSPRQLNGPPFIVGQPFPYAESFTSKGGTPILFDGTGARLATPIDRGAVDLTATDGGNNTFFGSDSITDPDAFPNFFGTSQAAPNAAAVAALLMQKFPDATNAQIELAMKQSAIDIVVNRSNVSTNAGIGIGVDAATGVGLIQADVAVQKLAIITNHAPVIGVEDLVGAVTELVTPPVGNLTDSGIINFTDADGVWAHIVSPSGTPVGAVVGSLTAAVTQDTAADGSGGKVTWSYTVPASAVEYLAAGETKVDTFSITLDDQHGSTITRQIAVTITGTSDAPDISVVTTDSILAALTETNAGLAAAGTLTVVDADVSDTVTPSVLSVVASGVTAGLLPNNAALKAMMAVSPPSIGADPGSTHNLNWAFNSGSEAFNYLDEGEVLTLAYTVRATDTGGLTVDQIVTVTVTGTNDGPSIDIVSGTDSAFFGLTDGNSALLAQGTLTVVDPDQTDSVTASVVSLLSTPAFVSGFPLMTLLPTTLPANPGTLANLTWQFSAGPDTFDYLAVGEHQNLSYGLRVVDDSGAFADKNVLITITGVNEAPVIGGSAPASTAVVELADGNAGENVATLSGTGTIAFSDTDVSDTHNASAVANGGGYLGTFSLGAVNQGANTVGWTFSVGDAALNGLGQGVVVHQSYTVTVGDGHGGMSSLVIGVDLIGSNDAAVMSSANVVLSQGLVPVSTGGTLTITDEDNPALFQPLTDFQGSYGKLTLGANGTWSYLADSPLLGLAPGDVASDLFTVHAVDGTPTTITVSITGSPDIAVAHSDHFTTTEAAAIGSGLSLFNNNGDGADADPDGPPLAIMAVNGDPAFLGHQIALASGALLTVNANGTFNYNPNGAFNTLTLASGAVNQSAFDSFTYSLVGGTQATVFVNITGLNTTDDLLKGNSLDNVITGFDVTGDTFRLEQGGHDTAYGLNGNDGFYMGAALDPLDHVDGAGGSDTLALQGNTTATLDSITNVEVILALSGSDTRFGDMANNRYDYNLTTSDTDVAAGQTMTVTAAGLLPGEDLTFNGSAETDGVFRMFAGQGNDWLVGGAGNDGFFFGADGNLTGADHVDGGGGTDSLALRGNYAGANAVVMQNGTIANVEVIAFLTGHSNALGGPIAPAGYDYDMTMADANIASGGHMDVVATGLAADESLRFDGRPETNGSFRILSGAGDDLIWGGAGNDLLYGAGGADRLIGGPGADTYTYLSAADSTSTGYDTIVGFDWHVDRIDAPGGGTRMLNHVGSGTLSTGSFDADLAAGLNGVLAAGGAALFAATGGTLDGHVFAVIDVNGVAGYQAGADLVIDLVNPPSPIDPTAGVIV